MFISFLKNFNSWICFIEKKCALGLYDCLDITYIKNLEISQSFVLFFLVVAHLNKNYLFICSYCKQNYDANMSFRSNWHEKSSTQHLGIPCWLTNIIALTKYTLQFTFVKESTLWERFTVLAMLLSKLLEWFYENAAMDHWFIDINSTCSIVSPHVSNSYFKNVLAK